MSNIFCVNKSGKSIPIYAGTSTGTAKIGNLMPREACGYFRDWGGDGVICKVRFLSTSGLRIGYIIDPPVNGLMPCSEYAYGTKDLGGTRYLTLVCRRALNVYNPDGSPSKQYSQVPAGCRVAFKTALSGSSHPEWKGVNYIEISKENWKRLNPSSGGYGFVDTGLDKASGYAKVPMYGSW